MRICHGYTFVGGCDPSKGEVTEWPSYPSATPTIFSGDLNENGIADEGDMCNLICVRSGSLDGMDISHPENPNPPPLSSASTSPTPTRPQALKMPQVPYTAPRDASRFNIAISTVT